MNTPTNGAVNPKSIVINWSELTDTSVNGRDLPTYYKLEWYNAELSTPAWEELTAEANGKLLTFTHTRSTVFPSGATQQYRVLPKNAYGYGTTYGTLGVQADSVPLNMGNPS
jgi:hypothetical protein